MKKRLLSLLLVAVLLLPMFSIQTIAANDPVITSHEDGESYAPDDFYIKWKAVSGAARYRLAVKSKTDGSYAADIYWDDKLTSNKYRIDEDDIKPGHKYTIWVGACGSGHNDVISQYSIVVTAEAEEKDNTCPLINQIKSSAGSSFPEGTSVTFSTRASDNALKRVTMYIDDERVERTSSDTIKYTTSSLSVGKHKIEVIAEDESGNENDTSITVTVTSKVCDHKNSKDYYSTTKYEEISNDNNYHNAINYYNKICSNCEETLKTNIKGETKKEAHSFSGNKCTVCKYQKSEEHKHTYDDYYKTTKYEQISGDETYHRAVHYYDTKCKSCETVSATNVKGNSEKEKHSFSGSKCTVCKYEKSSDECQHNSRNDYYKTTKYQQISGDNIYHKAVHYYDTKCEQCFEVLSSNIIGNTEKEKHVFSGKICSVCKYEQNDDVCSHEEKKDYYSKTEYEKISNDDNFHYAINYYDTYCEWCDEKLKSNKKGETKKERHNFVGEICNDCNYAKETIQIKEAEITSANVSPTSGTVGETKFKFTVKTNKDTEDIYVKAYNGYRITSNNLNELKTSTSGNTKTWTFWLKINDINSQYVNIVGISEDGEESTAKKVSFKVKEAVIETKDSEITSANVSPTSGTVGETKFKFTVKTNKDTEDIYVKAYNGYRITSNNLNDLKTSTSGSTKTWTFWLKINDINSQYVNVVGVTSDGNESTEKKVTFKVKEPVVVTKESKINSASVSPTSGTIGETKFKFTVKTNKDTEDIYVKAYNGYVITSDKLNDLKTSTSGNTKTWTFWLKINDINSQYVNVVGVTSDGNESAEKKVTFKVKEPIVVTKESKINSASVSPTSGTIGETKFKFTVKTNKDTEDIYVKAYNGYVITSDKLNDLKTSTSGNTKTWTFWLKINDINSQYVNVVGITEDGAESSAKKISFKVKEDDSKVVIGEITSSAGKTYVEGTYSIFSAQVTGKNLYMAYMYVNGDEIDSSSEGKLNVGTDYFEPGIHEIKVVAEDKKHNKIEKILNITVTSKDNNIESEKQPEVPEESKTESGEQYVYVLAVNESVAFKYTYVNGNETNVEKLIVENDKHVKVPPYITNKRALIPLRFVSTMFGAQIDYKDGYAIIRKGGVEAKYKSGKNYIIINGVQKSSDAAPATKKNHTFVPIRMLCQDVFGLEVGYDSATGIIVIYPQNISVKSYSEYNKAFGTRHTHKYKNEGNGTHTCYDCLVNATKCSGNPCGKCGYSKPVVIVQPTVTQEQKENIAQYYEVEQLIMQRTKPFYDYRDTAFRIVTEKNTDIEALKAVANLSISEGLTILLSSSPDAFYEKYWEYVFAELIEQATQHQNDLADILNDVSDVIDSGSNALSLSHEQMKLIDKLSKKIDSSVVYRRNSQLTSKWGGIFEKFAKDTETISAATKLLSVFVDSYSENAQFLIALDEVVESHIEMYKPDYGNAMRKAMDSTVMAYQSRASAALNALLEITEDKWNNFVLQRYLPEFQLLEMSKEVILELSKKDKFMASTKSIFMCCIALHLQDEFVRIGNIKRGDGFDYSDNQYMRNMFELCRAAAYKTYEYFGVEYTDKADQKWINDAKNSILGRSIASYLK